MTINTTVYVGSYLVCKMRPMAIEGEKRVCSKNKKHEQDQDRKLKFCPMCAAKVITEMDSIDAHQSFGEILYEKEPRERSKDEKELVKKFDLMEDESIGFNKKGYEVLLASAIGIDADSEGIRELKPAHVLALHVVDQNDVALLKKVVGYESVEIKFGALVQLA